MLYQNIFKTLTKFPFCVISKDYINILWRQIIFKTTTCTELVESCRIKVKKNIKMILNESFLQHLPDAKLLTWFQLLTGNNIPLLVSRDVCVFISDQEFWPSNPQHDWFLRCVLQTVINNTTDCASGSYQIWSENNVLSRFINP